MSSTTLIDFYMEYPYKKQDECITCKPYVSNDEVTEHSYSLTYKEWKSIMTSFFKNLTLYLARGYVYRFSSRIGELQIVKYRPSKKVVDFDKTIKYHMKEQGLTRHEAINYIKENDVTIFRHNLRNSNGWKFITAWFRNEYPFKFARHWRVKLSRRKSWRMIHEYLKEKPSRWSKIQESKFNNRPSTRKKPYA